MANENDIGGRVSLDTTDFKTNIAALNRQIQIIDTGFRAAAAGMDDWGSSQEGLQQRITALNGITDLQREKVANLTAQYERVAAEQGESSRAAQALQVQINRETEALNRNLRELGNVTQSLSDMQNGSDDAVASTEDLGDAAQEAGDKLKEMGGAIAEKVALGIAAIGAAAVAAVINVVKFTDDTNKAMNDLQVQTGATTEEMEGFSAIAKDIYRNNFGNDMEDIAASMGLINQATAQTGDELKATTETALLMRDAFGLEVADSIKTVNTLMNNFGITADEAYALIAQGTQMGANTSGDLLDVLNEFAPHFAQLGLDANEFTDTLIQGASSGAFEIATVGDAVKEFGIITREGTDDARAAFADMGLDANKLFATFAAGGPESAAAFTEVVEKLGAMKDPIAQNTAGVALFGSMFEDLGIEAIKSLGDIDDNADMTRSTLADINNVKYNDIGSALGGIKRILISDLSGPISDVVMPAVNGLVDKIKNMDFTPLVDGLKWVIDNSATIAAGLAGIAAAMITAKAVQVVTAMVDAYKLFKLATEGATIAQWLMNAAMAANPIGIVVVAVAALAAGIIVLWKTNEGFRDAMVAVWDAIVATFNSVLDFVKGNWQSLLLLLANPIAGALKLLYDLNPQFKEWVDGIWDSIVTTFSALPGKISEFFGGVWDAMKQWGVDALSWVTTEVPKIIEGVSKFFGELPGKIGYALGFALGTLIKWGADALKWIIAEVPKMIDKIGEFFASLPGKIAGSFNSVMTGVKTWGVNVGSWIATEVPKLINSIGTFFAGLPGKIGAHLSTAFQGFSAWGGNLITTAKTEIPKVIKTIVDFFLGLPKAMFDIGGDIVRGLWDGIKSMTTWIGDKISEFSDGIIGGFKKAFDSHSPSRVMAKEGVNIGSGIAVGIVDSAGQVRSAMQGINDEISGGLSGQSATASVRASGSASSIPAISNSISFADMLRGANFYVRSDDDIVKIGQQLGQQATSALRSVGVN